MNYKHLIIIILTFFVNDFAYTQSQTIDEIVALVGKQIVLKSEIETQYEQAKIQGLAGENSEEMKCNILEGLLLQKLMLNKAELDSLDISENQVEASLNQRIRYFVSQIGSEQKLEEYYDKSIIEIKEEMRQPVREQLLVEAKRNDITKNVNITPSEVKKYFQKIPKDSLPLIETEYQLGQILKIPEIGKDELSITKNKLNDLRQRVLKGENFGTLAVLYSEDPGSAKQSGELGLFSRGEMQPEFEAVAFKLKKGEVSEIVKTLYGYHILQLIQRKGNFINVRHILIRPKVSEIEMAKAITSLDTIRKQIVNGEINFEKAAIKYSDDPGKHNGGMLVNPATNTTIFVKEQIEQQTYYVLEKLKIGELSEPIPTLTDEGKQAYRILYLKSKTKPHSASLKTDYNKLQYYALEEKKQKKVNNWILENKKETYFRLNNKYKECDFRYNW